MASRVDLLVANLLQTTGDALYIVPGEKLFMTRGDVRAVVGREPVGVESFRAVVAELVPGSTPEELAVARHRMPWPTGPGKDPVEIRPGMVFAMETYCPASDGISAARIEEEVVVTDYGIEVLTKFPAQELFIANEY